MKVLVIGQGGREHAIVHALLRSPSVTEVHALPGNDGIRRNALCHNLTWQNTDAMIQLCLRSEIDVVVIGPEDPLVGGLADVLRERGILVVGPSQAAARLEGSKIFAKEFMQAAGIPTARSHVVTTVEQTLQAAASFQPPFVLKADGLAAGKGVFVCKDLSELKTSAQFMFEQKGLGEQGAQALLEEFTEGYELSYLVLTNGQEFQALPIAQDHKRLQDNDMGPNTGGMGTVAPLTIGADLRKSIEQKIVQPTLQQMQKQGMIYRGVIFFGLMITKNGPSLLEYNCRFGDPETQVILPLLAEDLGHVFKELAQGKLHPLSLKNISATCVVMAAPGYPNKPEKGVDIDGDVFSESPFSYFIHAGTARNPGNGKWQVNGGRVIGAVGLGANQQEATAHAYEQAAKLKWRGMQLRQDIGKKI